MDLVGIFKNTFILNYTSGLAISGSSDRKESTCKVGDPGLITGLGRTPGEGHGTPPQYSCLKNSTDRGAWWATVHEVTKSQT